MQKTQLVPAQMPEMDRNIAVKIDTVYIEGDERKLNLLVKNNIENIYTAIIDLQSLGSALEPTTQFVVTDGKPGEAGYAVKGIRANKLNCRMKIEEVKHPTFVRISGESDGPQIKYYTTTTFNLIDRGDGTVLVMMSSKEKNTSFCAQWSRLVCMCPLFIGHFIVLLPFMYVTNECQVAKLQSDVMQDLKDYFNVAKVETTSFTLSSLGAVVVVAPTSTAPAPNDLSAQLENLKRLHEQGVLSDEEFKTAKMKVIQG